MQPPRETIPALATLPLGIATARLTLRPFVPADVEALFPLASQPALSQFMGWRAHADRAETQAYIERSLALPERGEGVVWAIVHEGAAVGCIGLESLRWQVQALRYDRAELGYWLAPALWGKGLMTEAATAIVKFGFEEIGLHKVTTRCFVDNHASRRVIEKTGFRFVGRAEDDVWRDTRWITHLLYEMTAPEWPDVHTTMRISRPRQP